MNEKLKIIFRTSSACVWVVALLASSSIVLAQSKAPVEPSAITPPESVQAPADAMEIQEEVDYVPLQVGDATQGLLAWQRNGDIASRTPRPIMGSVAQRSYERYLKSFEFPIPERLSSTVKSSPGSSGAK
ncbi:DUF3613 domain-containing protein [Variovorax sp. Varisp62]|uniref:DUF3613 domain-containing protein n=1 Tax=Variovorax sp. Varisp62 TaxID=3243049 RepID=UPI0039B68134